MTTIWKLSRGRCHPQASALHVLGFPLLLQRQSRFALLSIGLQLTHVSCSAREASAQKAYIHLIRTSSTPLELAKVCRKIHSVLTGNRAIRRAEEHGLVDANGMREIWRDLDRCWRELDSMLNSSSEQNNARRTELNQYVHAWKVSHDLRVSFMGFNLIYFL